MEKLIVINILFALCLGLGLWACGDKGNGGAEDALLEQVDPTDGAEEAVPDTSVEDLPPEQLAEEQIEVVEDPQSEEVLFSEQPIRPMSSEGFDLVGGSVAISGNGNILVFGASGEDSASPGVGADQHNNDSDASGAVFIYERSTSWTSTYFKASNPGAGDYFGVVALSADGDTTAVGAPGEASSASGIGGNQANNSAYDSGAVYVFVRTDLTWTQQVYIKASNTDSNDYFGAALSLSADGSTLAVGAVGEDSHATGIDGIQDSESYPNSGAVYVFVRTDSNWTQQAYVKASNTNSEDKFGCSVSLSADGNTLVVGAEGEDSSAQGVNGDQTNNLATDSGAAYIFTRTGSTWAQQAYIKASNTNTDPDYGQDRFGAAVSLAADGNTLAISAPNEASNASGVGGDQMNNLRLGSGAVYVFVRSGTTWQQHSYIKASNPAFDDEFGVGLALSDDGQSLAVGAVWEDSDQIDSGAVYYLTYTEGTWNHIEFIKQTEPELFNGFGGSLDISTDGAWLFVGVPGDDALWGDEPDIGCTFLYGPI